MTQRLLIVLLCGAAAAPTAAVGPELREAETAPVDSATVAEFGALAPDEVESRRQEAAESARLAEDAREGPKRLVQRRRAAALEPSRTEYWLAVTETELEMGYLPDARNSLASARVTIDFLEGEEREAAIRDYSLWVAWWDYEMGRYEKGLAWARRAVQYGAGLRGHLVEGLNFGRITNSWNDLRQVNTPFSPLSGGGNRRSNVSWSRINYAHENRWPAFTDDEALYWIEKSKGRYERDLSRWRDYGHWCEVNHAWTLAEAYYEKSIESLPIREGGWIERGEHVAPSAGQPSVAMSFWMNDRGGYLTGSAVAYCAFVHGEMRATGSGEERLALAENLELASARFAARFPESPWLRLWGAEALGLLGRFDEAVEEARQARRDLAKLRVTEPDVDRTEGRILILASRYADAKAPLERAVESFPEDAQCWTDLAVAELRTGHPGQARDHLERALDIDDAQPTALYERGLLRWNEGDRDGAIDDLERAAQLTPDLPGLSEMLDQLRAASRPETGSGQ